MGQALDRDGNVLGEATGETKKEVFDKLDDAHKEAHEIRITSVRGGGDEVPDTPSSPPSAPSEQQS
jgi:hypothetical protein